MAIATRRAVASAAANWVFEVNPPMGGAAGEAYSNTLASPGMPPAAVLAREAIQNSVDARLEGAPKVSVSFVSKALVGMTKGEFVRTAGLETIAARSAHLDLKEPNCLDKLADNNVPLNLLFVNDYNATGLAGDPDDPDSKFSRFLLSLGDGGKEHEEHGTGGSYGFGKSVYSSNSGILTIFAYSRTVDGSGRPMSLLFGCGYYRKHKFGEWHFTGRSWFGEDFTPRHANAQQVVQPLRDGPADEMASALGFDLRSNDDRGTSVMIVDATVHPADILAGVEDWWWPRLVSNLLDVRVIGADGAEQLPRPRRREDLRPFLEAFDIATGKSPANGKTAFRKQFNKSEGDGIGNAGFSVIERNEDDAYVVGEERTDAVALIRSPLMVVSYHRHWYIGTPVMAGAFVAADDIDDILRAAEPPAHDRWDRDARRLRDSTGRKRQIVDKVLAGIRRSLKQFQSAASPPPPPRPKRLTLLERSLASFLAADKRGPDPRPEPSTAPISLTYDKEPTAEASGNDLRLKAVFSVRLKADLDVESIRVRVRVSCPVVEDGQEGDAISVTIEANAALVQDTDKPGWFIFDLKQGEPIRIRCETESYNPLWTVRFVPEVEAVEAAE